MEQLAGLGAAAAAEIDQREVAAQRMANGRQMFAEYRRFGAGRVVLRQFGNRLEQARAERVVEELGCNGGLRLQQSGRQFLVQAGFLLPASPSRKVAAI